MLRFALSGEIPRETPEGSLCHQWTGKNSSPLVEMAKSPNRRLWLLARDGLAPLFQRSQSSAFCFGVNHVRAFPSIRIPPHLARLEGVASID
jgi:hypothetical protein